MRTVQMTLDESLLRSVDRIVKDLETTRSEFTRQALREAIKRHRVSQLEERHRKGYERYPQRNGEFGNWEPEQAWGEA